MAPLDRLRRGGTAERDHEEDQTGNGTEDRPAEESLRARLSEDPNDIEAFDALADLVRRHAAEGLENAAEGHEHLEGYPARDPQREADDAVWALAEEVAQNQRAWYPLIELARLSIENDREMALRRLATAAERDPSGTALASGLAMLRQSGHADDALGLGVGHWRPREHDVEAGRELVEAAVEAGRLAEARRHLEAMHAHPEQGRVQKLRQELERRIDRAERGGGGPRSGGAPRSTSSRRVVDVRESLRSFLRL
jgi:hypothetical protein